MIFQLILPVLLTPNNYSFHDQVIPPPDKLNMVYSDFAVWPEAAPTVLGAVHKWGGGLENPDGVSGKSWHWLTEVGGRSG